MENPLELRICEYNLENLFVSMAYYEGQDLKTISENEWRAFALAQLRRKQKPLAKLWGIAQAIEEIAPDVLMLIEVGGQESLENLNQHFLGNRFVPYFVEGNSRRGIDLGFLVRKDLGYQVEVLSNKETPVEVYSHLGKYTSRFSRDVAELRLHDGSRLSLILLLTHLKSKISTDQDYQGKDVRTAEAIALAGVFQGLRSAYPGTPVVVGGDFNNDLSSLDLELVKRTDLVDFHDLRGTPAEERFSFVYFDAIGTPLHQTLDYLLVSPDLRSRVVLPESFTYRYKGFYGIPHEPPGNFKERNQLPLDHYPVVVTLRLG